MKLYRVEDKDGRGPAYGREHLTNAWRAFHTVAPCSKLLNALVYDWPLVPVADRGLRGIHPVERCALTRDQFERAVHAVDGLEFVWPPEVREFEWPDDLVRVGQTQALFRPKCARVIELPEPRDTYDDGGDR